MGKTKAKVTHRPGEIDPKTGGEWLQYNDGRWEIKCCKSGKAENNPSAIVECSKHWRPDQYPKNHTCKFIDTSVESIKQTTLLECSQRKNTKPKKPLITHLAIACAKSNTSSRTMSSDIMIWLFNQILQFGYSKGQNNEQLDLFNFKEKELSEEITNVAVDLKNYNMQTLKKNNIVSAVIDAGTVRKHHNLEIALTVPGIISPFLYKSYKIKSGTKEEYTNVIQELHDELLNQGIALSGVCGDNLAAQKNGIDHTNPSAIQSKSYNEIPSVASDIEILKKKRENEENRENRNKITEELIEKEMLQKKLKNRTAMLYNPCVNHVLNLCFNDILNQCEDISNYLLLKNSMNY